jgi:hypothetical protein
MRHILLAACLFAPTLAFAGPAEDAALAPVKAFTAALNMDDGKAAAAAVMTPSQAITDEFAPFHWEGKTAIADWFAGDAADVKANGVTDAVVSIGKPLHVTISGDHAYVVVPMTYKYMMHGKKTVENALFTASEVKSGAGWLISAWTYALK